MDLGLSGRVALITGGSAGLGRASATALAEEGADVAIFARDPEKLAHAARAIGSTGKSVLTIAGDLEDASAPSRAVAETIARFGALHVLDVSSGGPPPCTFEAADEEAWKKAIDGTLLPTVRLIRAALPAMKAARFGRIVVITSSSVREPIPGLALSNAIRPGIAGMLKTLAKEVGRDGITVNNVAPGSFATPRIAHVAEANARRTGQSVDSAMKDIEAQIPVGRLGDPMELGRVVAFLASEKASYLTGQTLLVDGGKSASF